MSTFLVSLESSIFRMEGTHTNFKATKVVKDISNFDFDLYESSLEPIQKTTLPCEILEMILRHVFKIYLSNRDYRSAIRLATFFNKTFTQGLTLTLFGSSLNTDDHILSCSKISQTLRLLSAIHDKVFLLPYTRHYLDYKLTLQFKKDESRFQQWRPLYGQPWHYFDANQLPLYRNVYTIQPPRSAEFPEEEWNVFKCGEHLGDMVWMDGCYDGGYFEAKQELSPVLIIDGDFSHQSWMGFNLLYQLIYGENSGLFHTVKLTNSLFDDYIDEYDPYIIRAPVNTHSKSMFL